MSTVLVSEHSGIRTLRLNRPHRRNALTPEMQSELIAALESAATSSTTRVVILTGVGDHFCAGLDISSLKDFAAHRDTSSESALELEQDAFRISRVFRTLYDFPHPTIAAVTGYALAGGTGLATLCDFTLATPVARFGYTEVKIGFMPALVSAYLVLQVGEKRARSLLLTGRIFPPEEALALGLVTKIVPAEALAAHAEALAESLIELSPGALTATKLLVANQNRFWLDAAIEHALAASAAIRQSPNFREGVTAFLEKRKPTWQT